jgi:hypothetical protein
MGGDRMEEVIESALPNLIQLEQDLLAVMKGWVEMETLRFHHQE